ncbi:hypothetical protein SAMN05421869_10977 [Nonomuraea jiangxiensis]|uniref:Uncharacterized protein n=1 Tax=Nonomuraea jiangxiensis TaxID=633440 RepID=A0A1G8RJ28_9ACTN|nr:hypothetical protein SAMN05421869_10977 [Nonomuraea jiangxiensis]
MRMRIALSALVTVIAVAVSSASNGTTVSAESSPILASQQDSSLCC